VVRLKGGDPMIFGRGGEEAAELAAAGVPFEIVPGISSTIAGPAYAGIPVTHRDHNTQLTIFTGHEDPTKGFSSIDYAQLAKAPGTKVFVMGVARLREITGGLHRTRCRSRHPDRPHPLGHHRRAENHRRHPRHHRRHRRGPGLRFARRGGHRRCRQ
jgi:siroheme synthase